MRRRATAKRRFETTHGVAFTRRSTKACAGITAIGTALAFVATFGTAIPATASGSTVRTDNVAQIATALTNGNSVILTGNVPDDGTLSSTVRISGNPTLNLNGHTLVISPTTRGNTAVSIQPGSSLTITGGGTLEADGADGMLLGEGDLTGHGISITSGTLNVDDVHIIATGGDGALGGVQFGGEGIVFDGGGTLIADGADISTIGGNGADGSDSTMTQNGATGGQAGDGMIVADGSSGILSGTALIYAKGGTGGNGWSSTTGSAGGNGGLGGDGLGIGQSTSGTAVPNALSIGGAHILVNLQGGNGGNGGSSDTGAGGNGGNGGNGDVTTIAGLIPGYAGYSGLGGGGATVGSLGAAGYGGGPAGDLYPAFHVNGGTAPKSAYTTYPLTGTLGALTPAAAMIVPPTGDHFVGWSESSEPGGDLIPDGTTVDTLNDGADAYPIYAQWEAIPVTLPPTQSVPPQSAPTQPFKDVPATAPFASDIDWLYSQHITSGYSSGLFKPVSPTSRAAAATFLYRLAGSPTVSAAQKSDVEAKFSDITESRFADAIAWALANHITTGYPDGTFRPNTSISRAAMAAFLYRNAGSPTVSNNDKAAMTSQFTGIPAAAPFVNAIAWEFNHKITTGYSGGTFRPSRPITREATAAMLHRAAALR